MIACYHQPARMRTLLVSSKQSSGGADAVLVRFGLGRNTGNRVVLTGDVVEKGYSILPALWQTRLCSLFWTSDGDIDLMGGIAKGLQQLRIVEIEWRGGAWRSPSVRSGRQ